MFCMAILPPILYFSDHFYSAKSEELLSLELKLWLFCSSFTVAVQWSQLEMLLTTCAATGIEPWSLDYRSSMLTTVFSHIIMFCTLFHVAQCGRSWINILVSSFDWYDLTNMTSLK